MIHFPYVKLPEGIPWVATQKRAKRPHAVLVLVPHLAQPHQVAGHHAEAICRVASGVPKEG